MFYHPEKKNKHKPEFLNTDYNENRFKNVTILLKRFCKDSQQSNPIKASPCLCHSSQGGTEKKLDSAGKFNVSNYRNFLFKKNVIANKSRTLYPVHNLMLWKSTSSLFFCNKVSRCSFIQSWVIYLKLSWRFQWCFSGQRRRIGKASMNECPQPPRSSFSTCT